MTTTRLLTATAGGGAGTRDHELTISRKSAAMLLLVAGYWAPLPFLAAEYRLVALPVSTILSISTIFLMTLWRWNRRLPVFEIGTLFGAVATLYAAVPALNFLSAGLTWTALSDGRLLYYQPGPSEVSSFTWPYAGFLGAFAFAYLAVRGRRSPVLPPVERGSRSTVLSVVVLWIAVQLSLVAASHAFNINFDPTYVGDGLAEFSDFYRLPHVVQQVLHNVFGWHFTLKLILLVILMRRWRESRAARWILVGAILLEVGSSVANMGSRTHAALLVLAAVLAYHRLVRPIGFRTAFLAALVVVLGFTLYGTARTVGGKLSTARQLDRRLWTTSSDFQTMWASAWVVEQTMRSGRVGSPPWQAHVIDLVLIVPSQLLPFQKVDPSAWFYAQLGATQSSMFGIRAQPVIGYGAPEFALRGAFLGILFALLHRWYIRRSASLWMTVFYLFACLWSHYIFRSTMLWPVYFVVYELVPVMLLARFGALILQRAAGGSEAAAK